MKQLALTLAVTLALAAPVFACSKDAPTHDTTAAAPGAHVCPAKAEKTAADCHGAGKAITTAAGSAKPDCCAKADATAATCPHAAKAAAAATAEAKPDCCAAGEKAAGDCHGALKPTQTAEGAAKPDCCVAGTGLTTATKASADATPAGDSPVAPTLTAEAPAGRHVSLTGRVLCERCNLGRSDSCHSVFQADGQEALIDVSTESDIMGLRKASEHGEKTLKLEGVMQDGANGPELRVLSWAAPSV